MQNCLLKTIHSVTEKGIRANPDGRPAINVDEEKRTVKEKRRRREFQVSRRRRAREENSRGHKSRTGGVGSWKESSLEGGREPRAGARGGEVQGARGREVSAGDAAITGMVEDEKHRWQQEGGGEGGWRAADAGRDMLYDVCSSHRPSLIN